MATLRRILFAIVLLALGGPSCRQTHSDPPQHITFAVGTKEAFARQLIEDYNASLPLLRVSEEKTYGAFVVVSSLQHGRSDLGIAQADAVYLAYRRGVLGDPRPHTELRGMAVLGVNPVQVIVRRNSSIYDVRALRGKRVGLMEQGTSSELVTRFLLSALDMTYDDLHARFQRFGESITQMEHGSLDAAIVVAPIHDGPTVSALRRADVRALSLDHAVVRALQASHHFLKPVIVSPAHLWGQTDAVETVGADALLVCRKSLTDDLVYQLTRELFLALPRLAQEYPDAADVDVQLASTTPIPLHPGAARYYREREIFK